MFKLEPVMIFILPNLFDGTFYGHVIFVMFDIFLLS